MAKQINTKVITNEVRLSYANIWEPKSINGGTAKYSSLPLESLLSYIA